MADWLKNALSGMQCQLDNELKDSKIKNDTTKALIGSAIVYMHDSGVYETIARFFHDLGDHTTATKVLTTKDKSGIDYEIGWQELASVVPDLRTINSWTEEGKVTGDGNTPDDIHCAGNHFYSSIKLSDQKEVCPVIIAILFCRDSNFTFTPVIKISFTKITMHDGQDTFTVVNPLSDELDKWLKETTSKYLSSITPTK
ncbi:MAG TPA: hypothetical protein PLI45_04010 [Candidatus Woesebacteria bacterium]|nr:hypothetical protein [Candidatus Woesebacteria bacterium]